MSIRESEIEQYLVDRVKDHGGIAYKFTSPERRNVPDRLVLLPGVPLFFVECKASNGALSDGQQREIQRIAKRGATVYVVNSFAGVDQLLTTHTLQ